MENSQQHQKIVFDDAMRQRLITALDSSLEQLGISEPVTLIDGFVNQPFSMELSNSVIIGGPTIPMVILLGDSGRIYLFAVKAILKDMDL